MHECIPGGTVPLRCGFNNTDGSADDATSPTAHVLDSADSGITGSPFTLTKRASLTGYYGANATMPSDAAYGTEYAIRYYGTCDGETPHSVDTILIVSAESLSGGIGTGANEVVLTLTCASVGVINQRCIVKDATSGVVVGAAYTDPDGKCYFQIDDGTYKVWYGPSNSYTFSNPYALTVSGDTAETYTCTAIEHAACGLSLAAMRSTLQLGLQRLQLRHRVESTLLDQFINQAMLEVDRRVEWTWTNETITTTADLNLYTRPGDVEAIVAVHSAKYTVASSSAISLLRAISMEQFIVKQKDSVTAGVPQEYVLQADRLYLYPTPEASSDTLELVCLATPPELSGDSDKPTFSCHLHDLVITGAMAPLYWHLQEDEMGAHYQAVFEDGLTRAAWAADVNRSASTNVSVMGP